MKKIRYYFILRNIVKYKNAIYSFKCYNKKQVILQSLHIVLKNLLQLTWHVHTIQILPAHSSFLLNAFRAPQTLKHLIVAKKWMYIRYYTQFK